MGKIDKKEKFISSKLIFKEFGFDKSDIEMIRKSWNNMPEDMTSDERMMFIELIEKTIKVFYKTKQLYNEEQRKNLN